MKTPDQITDDIKARQAELQSLISEHQQMVGAFQRKSAENQVRANHLEGMIEAYQGLLAKEEPDTAGREGDGAQQPQE